MLPFLVILIAGLSATTPVVGQENGSAQKLVEPTGEPQSKRQTELMLRKHIDGMRSGKPIYEMMTPVLISAVKPYEVSGKARLEQLGAIRNIEFRGTSSSGIDSYYVQYEHGASDYLISLTTEGKISALVVRPEQ